MKHIIMEKDGPIGIIRLNRPKVLNAINQAMAQELREAFQKFKMDEDVRVVILTGEGRAFCTGRDLKEYDTYRVTPIKDWEARLHGLASFSFIEEFEKPVIAAINGYALAGGCEMAAACDIRIASENVKIGQPEITRGFFPGAGATYLLPRVVGKSWALELILTGEPIDAAQALRIGLVNHVVPQEQLERFARELAGKIAGKPSLVLKTAKEAVCQGEGKDLRAARSISMALRALGESVQEKDEGVRAFVKKEKSGP